MLGEPECRGIAEPAAFREPTRLGTVGTRSDVGCCPLSAAVSCFYSSKVLPFGTKTRGLLSGGDRLSICDGEAPVAAGAS